MSFFGLSFGQNADLDIVLDGQDERKMAEIKDENGRKERHYLYFDGESVTGKVNVTLHRKTNKLEHQGIKIEFIGQIELYYDRGNHHEFLSLVKQLAGPGELTQNTSFDFEFNQVEKPYENYTGANVRLRYFIRVSIVRRLTDMTKEMDLLVHTLASYPEMNNPIKMEVGIEECLHIEFEYNKSKYHLKDVIVGKIYFLLVRIKIKHMEVAIIKRETTGSGPNTFHDNETIAKYEIMDGAPVKGESIPIRVFLAGYDLTPTMRDINKKFSVKYYLNLVLVDEEERRYFKQQEITLWRKGERARKAYPGGVPAGAQYQHQLPAAMARHIAGDVPSQNIRTAPTPSEPNTPSVEGQFQGQGQPHFHSVPIPGPHTIPNNPASGDQARFEREEPKPVPEMSKQVAEESKPVLEDPKPVLAESKVQEVEAPKPVSEPVIQSVTKSEVEPVPVAAEPVPVAAEPVPVSAEPVPVAVKPVPVVAEPVPVAAEPVPVAAEPVSVAKDPAEANVEEVTEKLAEATVQDEGVQEKKQSDPEPVKAEPEPVKTSSDESPEKFRESPPPMLMPDDPDDDLDLAQGSDDEDISDITEEKKTSSSQKEPVPS